MYENNLLIIILCCASGVGVVLRVSRNIIDFKRDNGVNRCPLESHPRKLRSSGQILLQVTVSLYSSHMAIVPLVLEPPLCETGWRQILEMCCLLKLLNPL